jgi:predicted phosphodiesterase
VADDFARPIRIFSDFHLGHSACIVRRVADLAPLFDGAATVIFNGDTAELRVDDLRSIALEDIRQLEAICGEAGARVVFVNGNHDPDIGGIDHLDLLGGAILVTHGDLLYDEIAPWGKDAPLLRKAHEAQLAAMAPEDLGVFEKRLRAAKAASRLALDLRSPHVGQGFAARVLTHLEAVWPPWRVARLLRIWAETPEYAARLADRFRPAARAVIFGHTHWAGVWRRHGRLIVNTGGLLSVLGRCAVEIDATELRVRKIGTRGGGFQLAPPHFRIALADL